MNEKKKKKIYWSSEMHQILSGREECSSQCRILDILGGLL